VVVSDQYKEDLDDVDDRVCFQSLLQQLHVPLFE